MEVLRRKCSPKKLKHKLRPLSKLKSKEKKAEKISKPKRLQCYVAVAEYAVQAPGEIPLQPGLKVEVVEKSDSGWWFVNSEDQQGWVPSTYLEPEGGANPEEKQGPLAGPGQEENFICIEKFEGASADEVSLEKGTVVQVLQKNMDGWWLVRYNGKEAYAPGAFLKKANNAQTVAMVEKSRLSGVEIISSLQDVSNLLNQEAKADQEQGKSSPPAPNKLSPKPIPKVAKPGIATAIIKQRSLERGGSLVPPPRQNSIMKMKITPAVSKSSVYVTVEDFDDTVGDGLSFQKGEKVHVTEKSASGWWFVTLGDKEGWVPASYLEPSTGTMDSSPVYELASPEDADARSDDDDDDDEEWYQEPDSLIEGPDVIPTPIQHTDATKRPLPPLPPDEDTSNNNNQTQAPSKPLPTAPSAKKPSMGIKPPDPPKKLPAAKPPVNEPPSTQSPELPKTTPNRNSSAGPPAGAPQDLAAMLKARFEARSGAAGDSGNSSDEESTRTSKPIVPKPDKGNKPAVFKPPVLPQKPSDLKRESRELSPQPGVGVSDRKTFSKPAPPAKFKPAKPIIPSTPAATSDAQTSKPATPAFPLKPTPKQPLRDTEKPSNSPPRSNVKSMTALFGNGQNLKPAPGEKPKPVAKPAVANKSKPTISTKPKPSIPSKTAAPAGQRSSQGVNNLVNSLSGKLNFGQKTPSTDSSPSSESSQSEMGARKPAPAVSLKPAAPPPAVPSPASSSKTYVATFDFVAENEGEIGFYEGDEVEVLEQNGDWSLIRIWDEEGWAPTNYLKKV